MQNMIQTVKFSCFLYGKNIRRPFDNTDNAPIPFGIRTDRTQIFVRQILADRTEMNIFFSPQKRRRKPLGLGIAHFQNGKRQPLRSFRADIRQSPEFINQFFQRGYIISNGF